MKYLVIVPNPARQLILLIFLLWSPVSSATPTLVQVLFEVPSGRTVEISLTDGSRYDGTIAHVSVDSVLLDVREPEWAGPTKSLALIEITRVRERRSNTGRGAGWGAVSGAFIGGGFGLNPGKSPGGPMGCCPIPNAAPGGCCRPVIPDDVHFGALAL